jgi:flagellar protein FliO/FliZ
MEFAEFIRAVFALLLTLGLIGVAAVIGRRFAPGALERLRGSVKRERRMAVVETLMLDPARRLVLVSIDGRERLLLLGDGRWLDVAQDTPAEPS